MTKREDVRELHTEQTAPVSGGAPVLGIYTPGAYKEEAKAFFRLCVGAEIYERAMSSEAGRRHHYVAARAFLNQADWEKFVWIEQYGSLAGYPE